MLLEMLTSGRGVHCGDLRAAPLGGGERGKGGKGDKKGEERGVGR